MSTTSLQAIGDTEAVDEAPRHYTALTQGVKAATVGKGMGPGEQLWTAGLAPGAGVSGTPGRQALHHTGNYQQQQQQQVAILQSAATTGAAGVAPGPVGQGRRETLHSFNASSISSISGLEPSWDGGGALPEQESGRAAEGGTGGGGAQERNAPVVAVQAAAAVMPAVGYGGGGGGGRRDSPGRAPEGAMGVSVSVGGWQRGTWGGVRGAGKGVAAEREDSGGAEGVQVGMVAVGPEGLGQRSSEASQGQAEGEGLREGPVTRHVGSGGLPPRRGGRGALPEDFSSGSEESDGEPDRAWRGAGGPQGGGRGYGFFDAAASGDGGRHAATGDGSVDLAGPGGERWVAEGAMAGGGVQGAVGSRSSSESERRTAQGSGDSGPGLVHGSGMPPPPAGERPDSTATRYPSGSERWRQAPFGLPSRSGYVSLGPGSHHRGPAGSGAGVAGGGDWAVGGGVGGSSGSSSGSRPRIASAAPSGGSGSGGMGTAGTGSGPRIGSVGGSGGGASEQPSAGRLSGEGSLRSGRAGGHSDVGSEPSSLSGEDLPGVGGLERHVPSWRYRRDSSDSRVSERGGNGGGGGGEGEEGFGAVRLERGAGVGEGGGGGLGGAPVTGWGSSGQPAVGQTSSQDGKAWGVGSGASRGVDGGGAIEEMVGGDQGAGVGGAGGGGVGLGWASDWLAAEAVSETRNWWDEDAGGLAADQGQAQQQGAGQQGAGGVEGGSERPFGEEEQQHQRLSSQRQRDESDSGGHRKELEESGGDGGELGEAQGASAGPPSPFKAPSGAAGTVPSGGAGSLEQQPGAVETIASSAPASGSVSVEQQGACAASRASSDSQESLRRTSTQSLDHQGGTAGSGGHGATDWAAALDTRLPGRAPSAGVLHPSGPLPPRYPSSTSLGRRVTADPSARIGRASQGDAIPAQGDAVTAIEPPTNTSMEAPTVTSAQGLVHPPADGTELRVNVGATGVGTACDSTPHTSAAAPLCAGGGNASLPQVAPLSHADRAERQGPLEWTISSRPWSREVYTKEVATSASLPSKVSQELFLPPLPAHSASAVAGLGASRAFAEVATQYCPFPGDSGSEEVEGEEGRQERGAGRGGPHKRVRVEQAGGAAGEGEGSGERPTGRGRIQAADSGTSSEWELEAMVPPAPATGKARPWLDAAMLAIACGQGQEREQGQGQQPYNAREDGGSGPGLGGPALQLPPFHVGSVPARPGKARRWEMISVGGATAWEDGGGDALMADPSAVSGVSASEGADDGLVAEDSPGQLRWQAQLPAWLPHYAPNAPAAAVGVAAASGSPGAGEALNRDSPHTTAPPPTGSAHVPAPHLRPPVHHHALPPPLQQHHHQHQHRHPHLRPEISWPGGPKVPPHASGLRPSHAYATDAHSSPVMAPPPDDQAYPTQLRPARAPGFRGPAPEAELHDDAPSPHTRTRGTSSPGGHRLPAPQQQQQQQPLHILPSQVCGSGAWVRGACCALGVTWHCTVRGRCRT